MPFLRLETATPSETEKTIEKQAEEIRELKNQLASVSSEKSDLNKRLQAVEEKSSNIEKLIQDLKKQIPEA
jgi:uncharacterized coiled-coil protein SlyX